MRPGVVLPFTEPGGTAMLPTTIADGARRLEGHGFGSLWVFDAIGRGFALPDPLTALAVAATVTDRIELGTCILQVPLRRPVELAHRVMTTQLICDGRLLLGVGAGSTEADFDTIGVPFDQRFARLGEALPMMRRLWAGEAVGGGGLSPWPTVAGGPPVLIGSWAGGSWIPRAAQEFDGWIASAAKTSYDDLAAGIARFRELGGTRAVVTNVAVDLNADTTFQPDDGPFDLRCDASTAGERLTRLAELGFDDVVMVTGDHSDRSPLPHPLTVLPA